MSLEILVRPLIEVVTEQPDWVIRTVEESSGDPYVDVPFIASLGLCSRKCWRKQKMQRAGWCSSLKRGRLSSTCDRPKESDWKPEWDRTGYCYVFLPMKSRSPVNIPSRFCRRSKSIANGHSIGAWKANPFDSNEFFWNHLHVKSTERRLRTSAVVTFGETWKDLKLNVVSLMLR